MNRNKIQIGVALVVAIFYTLPWIALAEQSRAWEHAVLYGVAIKRITFLFTSVFLTTLLFFQYNLHWKLWLQSRMRISVVHNLLLNAGLIVLVCFLLVKVTHELFPREVARPYMFHYATRTSLIAFVSFLVCHVLDLVSRLEQEKFKTLTLEKQKAESDLEILKAQINPHFFFNSLTSLTVLIREDAKKAIEFVNHLSNTFRYILEKRELAIVTLQDELRYLESYIFMMHERFGSSLQIDLQLDELTLSKGVPQFALQLVVENAIKHNVISAKCPLTISILSSPESVVIRNNKQLKKSSTNGFGIGLKNLHLRYFLLQKKEIITKQSESYYEVTLPLL